MPFALHPGPLVAPHPSCSIPTPPQHKLHEGKNFCQFCSLHSLSHQLEQCSTCNQCSTNTCLLNEYLQSVVLCIQVPLGISGAGIQEFLGPGLILYILITRQPLTAAMLCLCIKPSISKTPNVTSKTTLSDHSLPRLSYVIYIPNLFL